jgi:hypothetical protein
MNFELLTHILVNNYRSASVNATARKSYSPVGVFRMVALRTASMNSAAVGTGAMAWRPATEAIA